MTDYNSKRLNEISERILARIENNRRVTSPTGTRPRKCRREFLTREEESEIGWALWLSLAFIFIVLAAMMESVSIPLLILLSVPMALAGVFAIFWLTSPVFDSFAKIGLVLLFGVAVNNAILLVSGTTIVGLAPLLVHLNETADKDIWENLALATIGGLMSSTILLLSLTPALYTTTIRLYWALRRFLGWLRAKWPRRSRVEAAVEQP